MRLHGFTTCDLLDSIHINEQKDVIKHLWENLKELTDTRREVLATAKKIHTFNRDANDIVHQIKVLHHFMSLITYYDTGERESSTW